MTIADATINGVTVGKGGGNNMNMALGFQVLNSNTTGSLNTAIGYRSMYLNTLGNNNSAF